MAPQTPLVRHNMSSPAKRLKAAEPEPEPEPEPESDPELEPETVVLSVQGASVGETMYHFVPFTKEYFPSGLPDDARLSLGYWNEFAKLTSQALLDDLWEKIPNGNSSEHLHRIASEKFAAFIPVCGGG